MRRRTGRTQHCSDWSDAELFRRYVAALRSVRAWPTRAGVVQVSIVNYDAYVAAELLDSALIYRGELTDDDIAEIQTTKHGRTCVARFS